MKQASIYNINTNHLFRDVNHANIDENMQNYNTSLIKTAITGNSYDYKFNTNNTAKSNENSSSK